MEENFRIQESEKKHPAFLENAKMKKFPKLYEFS